MIKASLLRQSRHDALGNQLDQRLLVDLAGAARTRRCHWSSSPAAASKAAARRQSSSNCRGRRRWRRCRSSPCPVEPRVLEAPLLLQIQQLARFAFGEVVHLAQVVGQHQDAAVGVENFRPPVGLLDRFAEADRAVVGQDDDVRLLDERQDRVGELLAAGRFVLA